MLQAGSKQLDELLIRALARKPGMTGKELQEQLSRESRPCTIQGVNHELRKLIKSGVIVKLEGRYSLSMVWASEFVGLADEIYDRYLTSIPAPYILPEEGERKSWTFPTLERSNDFSVQVIFLLLNQCKERIIYQWQPHPVMALLRANQNMRLQQILEVTERIAYRIIGTRTPLSQDCLRRWNKRCVVYSDAVSSFEQERTKHLTIVGEYLLGVTLTKEFSDTIEGIFRTYKSVSDALTHGAFAQLRAKTRIKVTLEHSKRRSAEHAKTFINYFGLNRAGRAV